MHGRRSGAPRCDFNEHKLFEHGLRAMDDHRVERAEKVRKNLEKAQAAARCEHEYLSGVRCKAPRMKDGKLCACINNWRKQNRQSWTLGQWKCGQHPDWNQEAAGSDYRWNTGPSAGGTIGVHAAIGGLECEQDEEQLNQQFYVASLALRSGPFDSFTSFSRSGQAVRQHGGGSFTRLPRANTSSRVAELGKALGYIISRLGALNMGSPGDWCKWGCRDGSVKKRMAPQVGLEPTTLRLTAGCSAIELLRSEQASFAPA